MLGGSLGATTDGSGATGRFSLLSILALSALRSSRRRNCQNPRLIITTTSNAMSTCESSHRGRSTNRYRDIECPFCPDGGRFLRRRGQERRRRDFTVRPTRWTRPPDVLGTDALPARRASTGTVNS